MTYGVYKTKAGLKYSMDDSKHVLLEIHPDSLDLCEGYIVAREYFLTLCPVIATFIILFLGYTKFYQIFGINIIAAVLSALFCRIFPVYKIPGISFISAMFGFFILRFFIHFIVIGILSFTVFKNGWILLYYIISAPIASTISTILTGYNQMLKQNNEIADYVLHKNP